MAGRTYRGMTGLKASERALGGMKASTARGVVSRFLKKRAKPFADDMKTGAAKLTGAMAEGVGVGTKLTRRQRSLHKKGSDLEVFAGPSGDPAAIANEFGALHKNEFGSFNQVAQPFVRPAWEANKDPALDGLADDLAASIDRTAKRQRRGR